jgi:hypothetical protein
MTAKTLNVYDPAMCCSSGVCGPDVDPNLVKFSADLDWLTEQGIEVHRFNLAQQPAAFASDETVKGALESMGVGALPLLLVDGHTVMSGAYPTRDQLAGWFGLKAAAAKTNSGCCSSNSSCC